MRRALWVLPAIVLGLAVPAHAAPITVSAGEVVTFNFDFVTPGLVPPTALGISFYTNAAPQGPGDFGLWTGYSELDGGGAQIYGPFNAILHSTGADGGNGRRPLFDGPDGRDGLHYGRPGRIHLD